MHLSSFHFSLFSTNVPSPFERAHDPLASRYTAERQDKKGENSAHLVMEITGRRRQ